MSTGKRIYTRRAHSSAGKDTSQLKNANVDPATTAAYFQEEQVPRNIYREVYMPPQISAWCTEIFDKHFLGLSYNKILHS